MSWYITLTKDVSNETLYLKTEIASNNDLTISRWKGTHESRAKKTCFPAASLVSLENKVAETIRDALCQGYRLHPVAGNDASLIVMGIHACADTDKAERMVQVINAFGFTKVPCGTDGNTFSICGTGLVVSKTMTGFQLVSVCFRKPVDQDARLSFVKDAAITACIDPAGDVFTRSGLMSAKAYAESSLDDLPLEFQEICWEFGVGMTTARELERLSQQVEHCLIGF